MLTSDSMHDFLSDESMVLEYRHMLLYFLPLTPAQRDRYIRQLAPRHQADLHRPGLGRWFLSEDAMEWIMGERRYRQLPPIQETPTRRLLLDQPVAMDDDVTDSQVSEPSDLGLDVSVNDFAGGMSDQQALILGRRLGMTAPNEDASEGNSDDPTAADNRDDTYDDDEGRVLTNAAWSTFLNYWVPLYQYAADETLEISQPITRPLVGLGTTISLAAGGSWLYQFWLSTHGRHNDRIPPSSSLWTALVLGGTTAGTLLLARSVLSSFSSQKKNDPKQKQ